MVSHLEFDTALSDMHPQWLWIFLVLTSVTHIDGTHCAGMPWPPLGGPIETFPYTYKNKTYQALNCKVGNKRKKIIGCRSAHLVEELPRRLHSCSVTDGQGKQWEVPKEAASTIDVMRRRVYCMTQRHFEGQIDGSSWPPVSGNCVPLSMAGFRRAANLQSLVEDVIARDVPGDFLEAGTWKGGLCLLVESIFDAYHQFPRRKVWLADSFRGIPKPTLDVDKQEHSGSHNYKILHLGGVHVVKKIFQTFGYLNDNTKWVVGFFKDSFPKQIDQWKRDSTRFAVIRLDGGLYESVWDSLFFLYPFVSDGGYVIIDDYTDWNGARKATLDYIVENDLNVTIYPVFHKPGEMPRGAWFRKPGGPEAAASVASTATEPAAQDAEEEEEEVTTAQGSPALTDGDSKPEGPEAAATASTDSFAQRFVKFWRPW
uniref:Macrocin O-methyltransferase n=1 Tax=Eutreptiella gymnastica TaxID=73025 RepID=A0A7S1I4P8_9EUGL|mmetsp:Transcript_129480/g.223733  ORF Transcript_129480/g.223733 Transcript_129480/m.223733 type:complete len:427 (+) Transcript_129480:35-1315(+)